MASPVLPRMTATIPRLEPGRVRRPGPENPLPYPDTPPLPTPVSIDYSALDPSVPTRLPVRRIVTRRDLSLFASSPTHSLILAFVFGLADAAASTPCSAVSDRDRSPAVGAILDVLDRDAPALLTLAPPSENPSGSRFGNAAFRGFFALLERHSGGWTASIAKAAGIDIHPSAALEASQYLVQAFGDPNRLDYGSGHELNLVLWLLCLYQLRILAPPDFCALALRAFPRYLALIRAVQTAYYLEPAGSHGVWGLDDYQFLPFLLGAAQLIRHPFITPLTVHSDAALEQFAADYLYLDQIAFTNSTKTVRGLRWHSPMLDDISSAKSWGKVEGGMRRMFVVEVLGKLPIMQHFLFAALIPAPAGLSTAEADCRFVQSLPLRPHHEHTGWGDCCGIKIPSTVAAAEETKKRGAPKPLRHIPFD